VLTEDKQAGGILYALCIRHNHSCAPDISDLPWDLSHLY
jgi:hypothetical protein